MPKTKTPRKRSVTVTDAAKGWGASKARVQEGKKVTRMSSEKAAAKKRAAVGDNSKDEGQYGKPFTTKSSTSKKSSPGPAATQKKSTTAKKRANSPARQIAKRKK